MKKLIVAALVVAIASVVMATDAANSNTARRKLTPKEKMERRAKRIAEAGGLVSKPYKGKFIYIVNDQKLVDEKNFFADQGRSIEGLFQLPVKIVAPKAELERPGLTITLSENETAPSLLVAPEVPWAGINVKALAADNPKHEILVSRLQKEIWRGFMYACGAANSVMQPCVMRHISKVSDLDRYNNIVPCPDSLPRVMTTANILGIESATVSTYKQACQEGWAPAPTNDIQKAIYDEVKAPPKNPMKIEFDPKKGR